MSFDLMIWEGKHPSTKEEALELAAWHSEEYFEESTFEPHPRIVEFADQLVTIWPNFEDLPEDDESSPCSTSPLISDASGPIMQVSMRWHRAEEAAPVVARAARELGLACVDGNGFIYSETSGVSPSIEQVRGQMPSLFPESTPDQNGKSNDGGLFGWFRRKQSK